MLVRLHPSLLLMVGIVVVVAAVDQSATEAALTTATTTTTVSVVTPQPSPNNPPLYSPEPSFPIVELIVECFAHLSMPCAQRKMVVYIDQLNRAKSVSIIGNLLQLVKTRPDTAPPLTEEVLTARQIQDQASLYSLLDLVADRFMDSHVLRLNLPLVENGRLISTPVDINFVDPSENSREGRGIMDPKGKPKKKGGKMKSKKSKKKMKKGGKKLMKMMMAVGKKGVEIMGKMIMFKMMMMFPIAMKKSIMGGLAGMASMGIMKMMMLKALFDKLKGFLAKCKGGGGGGGGGGGFFGGGDSCGGGDGGYGDAGGGYGGGGGGYGGGGGGYGGGGGAGWDRNTDTNGWNRNPSVYANYPYYYYVQRNDTWSK